MKLFFKKFRKKKKNSNGGQNTQNNVAQNVNGVHSSHNETKVLSTFQKNLLKRSLSNNHLVIDDAKSNRFILVKFLERLNIKCSEAENGQEALNIIEKIDNIDHFDIIWVDLKMPIMDGYQFTHILREKGYKGMVVCVTGNIEKESRDKCLKVGANHVLAKPLLLDEFVNLPYLQRYRQEQRT